MFHQLAFYISVIFHPVFLFFYAFNFFLFTNYSFFFIHQQITFYVDGFIFITSAALPAAFILWAFKDLFFKEQAGRYLPILTAMVFYGFTYIVLAQIPFPAFLHNYLLALIIGLGIVMGLNTLLKVSLHSFGAGSLVGLFFYLFYAHYPELFYPLVGSVLLAGIIGTSRLLLGAHTNLEIYVGYLVGIGTALGLLLMM